MRQTLRTGLIAASIWAIPALVEAQSKHVRSRPFSALFTNVALFGQLLLSLGIAWLTSIAIMAIWGPKLYPPNVARAGCGCSTTAWTVVFMWYFLTRSLRWHVPIWAWGVLVVVLMILSFTLLRRRTAAA